MACEVIELPSDDGEPRAAFLCRGPKTRRCWPCQKLGRYRASVALCDGPSHSGARKTCDAAICGEHRKNVGPEQDLCPDCVRRGITIAAAPTSTPAVTPARVDVQPSLFEGAR